MQRFGAKLEPMCSLYFCYVMVIDGAFSTVFIYLLYCLCCRI